MAEVYSDYKIFRHPKKLEDLKDGTVTAPIVARIKPTNVCDHRCYYCSTVVKPTYDEGSEEVFNPKDVIEWPILKRTIKELADIGTKAIIFSGGGEPLVYKQINEAIQLCYDFGLDVAIITNGWKLTGESANLLKDAKWVRISMNSSDRQVFGDMRGVGPKCFDDIIENLTEFAKIKKGRLGINYGITKENYLQVYEFCELMKSIGVDNVKFSPIIFKEGSIEYHNKFSKECNELIEKAKHDLEDDTFSVINKYEESLNTCTIFHRPYHKCYTMQLVACIAADSKVYYCHDRAYMQSSVLGDLKKETFKDIWFSDSTKEVFDNLDPSKVCNQHCVWDGRNIIITNYFDVEDENFI